MRTEKGSSVFTLSPQEAHILVRYSNDNELCQVCDAVRIPEPRPINFVCSPQTSGIK